MKKVLSIFFAISYVLVLIFISYSLLYKETKKETTFEKAWVTLTPDQERTHCFLQASSKLVEFRNELCKIEGKKDYCTLTVENQTLANEAYIKLNDVCEN